MKLLLGIIIAVVAALGAPAHGRCRPHRHGGGCEARAIRVVKAKPEVSPAVQVRLRDLEERVRKLKAQVWRTRSRLRAGHASPGTTPDPANFTRNLTIMRVRSSSRRAPAAA